MSMVTTLSCGTAAVAQPNQVNLYPIRISSLGGACSYLAKASINGNGYGQFGYTVSLLASGSPVATAQTDYNGLARLSMKRAACYWTYLMVAWVGNIHSNEWILCPPAKHCE